MCVCVCVCVSARVYNIYIYIYIYIYMDVYVLTYTLYHGQSTKSFLNRITTDSLQEWLPYHG